MTAWFQKIAHTAAEIEGTYYGKLTRVEEIIAFAKRIGAKKIGIATCIGLMNEAKIFAKILKAKGLESYSVICKVGSIDKNGNWNCGRVLKSRRAATKPCAIRFCRQGCLTRKKQTSM